MGKDKWILISYTTTVLVFVNYNLSFVDLVLVLLHDITYLVKYLMFLSVSYVFFES